MQLNLIKNVFFILCFVPLPKPQILPNLAPPLQILTYLISDKEITNLLNRADCLSPWTENYHFNHVNMVFL